MIGTGPIIVLEDDKDEEFILRSIFQQLGVTNKLFFFESPMPAMELLATMTESPLIILCDVNMPEKNGMEFKKEIDAHPELRKKSIPFIFYTTVASRSIVENAFMDLTVQGYFLKGESLEQMKRTIKVILEYWSLSRHPDRPF